MLAHIVQNGTQKERVYARQKQLELANLIESRKKEKERVLKEQKELELLNEKKALEKEIERERKTLEKERKAKEKEKIMKEKIKGARKRIVERYRKRKVESKSTYLTYLTLFRQKR